MARANTFNNHNFDNMWCPHARKAHFDGQRGVGIGGASVNVDNIGNANTKCLGLECPSLVITAEGEKNADGRPETWTGYCGETFGFIGNGEGS